MNQQPEPSSHHSHAGQTCRRPGMVNGQATVQRCLQPDGQTTYFKATCPIGYLLGSEVQGELTGYGATEETALASLAREQARLYESLWA